MTVLCIDDNLQLLHLQEEILRGAGFEVLCASDGNSGVKLARDNRIDAVILDYVMPSLNGERVARVLRRRNQSTPIILYSGATEIPERVFTLIDAYVAKTDGAEFLLTTLSSVLGRKKPA